MGYEYVAIELGFGAPAGLSGGPLIVTMNQTEVAGIVVENVQASTYVQSLTETREGDKEYVEKLLNTINYGLAVELGSLREWLDTHLPPK